jgi:uncharacterized protein YlxW (UPF0749 family)
MSDRIQELLDGIKEKTLHWHQMYSDERTANQSLQQQLMDVNAQLTTRQQEVNALQQQVDTLKLTVGELDAKLKMTQENNVSVSNGTGVSDEQIDELVREIDYCIAQLKK